MKAFQKFSCIKKKNSVSADMISMIEKQTLSQDSSLVGVSKQGLTIHSSRELFFIPENDFSKLLDQPVELFLSQYEIPFHGLIKKIFFIKEDTLEIQINFFERTPLYYRECVADLLN